MIRRISSAAAVFSAPGRALATTSMALLTRKRATCSACFLSRSVISFSARFSASSRSRFKAASFSSRALRSCSAMCCAWFRCVQLKTVAGRVGAMGAGTGTGAAAGGSGSGACATSSLLSSLLDSDLSFFSSSFFPRTNPTRGLSSSPLLGRVRCDRTSSGALSASGELSLEAASFFLAEGSRGEGLGRPRGLDADADCRDFLALGEAGLCDALPFSRGTSLAFGSSLGSSFGQSPSSLAISCEACSASALSSSATAPAWGNSSAMTFSKLARASAKLLAVAFLT
mmetsp:Transcript_23030/g.37497  ORF Transcript_23030/g.37497 Transcript_23030/m.37497 type:complete len:285 (+) Transcript_23030:617-1471(+)